MSNEPLTADRLRYLLIYCRHTGEFVWRATQKQTAGKTAGYANDRGYIHIKVDRVMHLAHRLAWLYVHGVMPSMHIDHINRKVDDNRIENLREATRSQNGANRPHQPSNKFGLKGVSSTKNGKFAASIRVSGRSYHIGTFATPDLAHAAYLNRAQSEFGEFSSPGNRN